MRVFFARVRKKFAMARYVKFRIRACKGVLCGAVRCGGAGFMACIITCSVADCRHYAEVESE